MLSPALKDRLKSMFRFGLTSGLATAIDFSVFVTINTWLGLIEDIFVTEMISATCGMIVNFFMQKRFVFQLQRKAYAAFFLSIGFSFVILFSGAMTMDYISSFPLFESNFWLLSAKITVMGVKFILNYFSKRWVFERKVFKH